MRRVEVIRTVWSDALAITDVLGWLAMLPVDGSASGSVMCWGGGDQAGPGGSSRASA